MSYLLIGIAGVIGTLLRDILGMLVQQSIPQTSISRGDRFLHHVFDLQCGNRIIVSRRDVGKRHRICGRKHEQRIVFGMAW